MKIRLLPLFDSECGIRKYYVEYSDGDRCITSGPMTLSRARTLMRKLKGRK